MNPIVILALIASLKQKVAFLETKLAAQESAQVESAPTYQNPIYPPTIQITPSPSPALGVVGTSTMCEYIVPGRGGMEMSCAAIQACSMAHNCPIVPQQ